MSRRKDGRLREKAGKPDASELHEETRRKFTNSLGGNAESGDTTDTFIFLRHLLVVVLEGRQISRKSGEMRKMCDRQSHISTPRGFPFLKPTSEAALHQTTHRAKSEPPSCSLSPCRPSSTRRRRDGPLKKAPSAEKFVRKPSVFQYI